MEITTSRFGPLEISQDEILRFSQVIIGMENLCEWVLFADAENDALGWLQNVGQADIALAVVSPRRFVPDYEVRVARKQLATINLNRLQDAQVLVIVGRNEQSATLNLKAPLVINLSLRLGCQVVAKGNYELQHPLSFPAVPLKKSA